MMSDQLDKKIIDGQEILFPTLEQWTQIENEKEINGFEITNLTLWQVTVYLPNIQKYPELCMGLGFIEGAKSWGTYQFLHIAGNLQRISLQWQTCSNCGWEGSIANPYGIDNYLGIPKTIDKLAIEKYADRYERLPCPKCKAKLSRPAIWIAY